LSYFVTILYLEFSAQKILAERYHLQQTVEFQNTSHDGTTVRLKVAIEPA
jgi:hypothetical protein